MERDWEMERIERGVGVGKEWERAREVWSLK